MNQFYPADSLTARAQPARERHDLIDLRAFMVALWRGKMLILAAALLATIAGGYYAYIQAVPKYRATAVMVLNAREERVVDFESVIGGLSAESSVVNTEVEVLKSRSLLAKVVAQLGLDQDPEFNRFLRTPSFLDTAKLTIKRSLRLTRPGPPLLQPDEAARMREATIDGLLDRLTIRNIPQSLVFQITTESIDPKKSAQIANSLTELYILNQLDVKFEATEQATNWLTQRVGDLQTALEDAEEKVKLFRAKTDLINPDALSVLEVQLKELRDRIASGARGKEEAAGLMEQLSVPQTPEALVALTGDVQLTQYAKRLEDPAIKQAFDTRVAQITSLTQARLARSDSQLAVMRTSLGDLERRLAAQSDDLIKLEQLSREADASRLLYEYFLGRLKETSAQQGIHQADSRVLSSAVVPTRPTTPDRPLIIGIFAVLGLTLGAGLALIREARSDTFRTARILEEATGYAVMGQLATLPTRRRRKAIAYLAEKPISAAAESVRNLRTSILLSDPDDPPKVLMVSSSVPGEGKTTIALALAQNMAGMGKRVLLIEGDIRRQAFTEHFRGRGRPGLVSVLNGDASLRDVVLPDPQTGSDVLLGERTGTSAADLFSSARFGGLIKELSDIYDHIIIDAPPVLVVPDARIISQSVDSVLFVVKWDSTSRSQVRQALATFEATNVRVGGLVLNQISKRGIRRYGYGDHFGGYGLIGRKYYVN